MKKINNKYRNSGSGASLYSLNYKFDSLSSAGKISGTALELIKKYNELAKEAHSNGNYTEMENFRQYAEHYRKIVTDINEKKNSFKQTGTTNESASTENEKAVETVSTDEEKVQKKEEEAVSEKKARKTTKQFKVVEISATKDEDSTEKKAVKRAYVRKKKNVNEAEIAEDKCANS